jgi:dTDP-4-amino-4,6-dideoxygalactose transaminase|tara:strand:+ start:316 stop:906 length:591 start_codon:yes stop_codon:yes gene_type:complete
LSFEVVGEFEEKIADFYGATWGVAVDSCTHGIELCLRYVGANEIVVPKRTYLSVPMLANKMNLELKWKDEDWRDYYEIGNTGVYDAAVLWRKDSYIPKSFMCISFQFQKHLSLGRGGMILTDDLVAKDELKKMSYDGRIPNVPWREQNVDTMGYHYYMTPETAQKGLDKFNEAKRTKPRKWLLEDWPDLTKVEVFK